jgi:hypothetical protein
LAVAAVIVGLVGCQDQPTPTSPDHAAVSAPGTVAAENAALVQVTRGLAMAIRSSAVRQALGAYMHGAGTTFEYKLELSRFLTSAEGQRARMGMRIGLRVTDDSVMALIRSLPSMELYMPVVDHRNRWAGEGVYVVGQLTEHDPIVGFDMDGSSVSISAASPPSVPTFVIVKSETDFSQPAMANAMRSRRPSPACRSGAFLCEPGGAKSGVVSGGSATHSAIPTWAPQGLYMTYSNISDLSEPWTRGNPEIEVILLGPRYDEDSTHGNSLFCAGEHQPDLSYFDQNGHYWDGAVLLANKDSLESNRYLQDPNRSLVITLWEDDNQACVIHDSDNAAVDIEAWLGSAVRFALSFRRDTTTPSWTVVLQRTYNAFRAPIQAALGNGDDDLLGVATPRAETNIVIPNADYNLMTGANQANGGIRLVYKGPPEPPPPQVPGVYISGPGNVYYGDTHSWYGNAVWVTNPVTYIWTIPSTMTVNPVQPEIVTGWVDADTTISVTVMDGGGNIVSASFDIHPEDPPVEGGCEYNCERKGRSLDPRPGRPAVGRGASVVAPKSAAPARPSTGKPPARP